jgi:hypothetical protein
MRTEVANMRGQGERVTMMVEELALPSFVTPTLVEFLDEGGLMASRRC